jgi:hypothetical protein
VAVGGIRRHLGLRRFGPGDERTAVAE